MPDLARIRAALHSDPWWAVYALADLAPANLPHCRWFLSDRAPLSAALLYSAYDTPIFWAQGQPSAFAHCASQIFEPGKLIVQIQAPWTRLVTERYGSVRLDRMWRLALHWPSFRPAAPADGDARLSHSDLPALDDLYSDGIASGERPPFFFPQMLDQGVFFGAWRDGRLVAAAGTHVFSPEESAAAIGNVYTRRDARRRGHAARLTSAVVSELRRLGMTTVALSVSASNPAAIAAYVRLGFSHHCEFFEGAAERSNATTRRASQA